MPDNGVNAPGPASYSAPLLNFSAIANWPNDYYQGVFNQQQVGLNNDASQLNQARLQQIQQQVELSKAFAGGLPTDPSTGQIDYRKAAGILAAKGDIGGAVSLLQQQPAPLQPMLGGPPAQGGAQGAPTGAQPASVQARPLPPPAASSPRGDSGQNTLTSLVTDRLPAQNQTTGETIMRIAQAMGIDPNAQLTPGQVKRAQGLLQKYAPETAGIQVAGASGGSNLPPSANAGSPAARVAQQPQRPTAQPQPQPQPQAGGQPLVPQEPLPDGYTDPMKAIAALRLNAARMAGDPRPGAAQQAQAMNAWAERIETSIKPVPMRPGEQLRDPRTGQIIAQGQATNANNIALQRYLDANPDATPEQIQAFVAQGRPPRSAPAMALQKYLQEHPEATSEDIQKFNAEQAGKSAEERAVGQRAGAIAIAVDEAKKTVPNVRALAQTAAGKGYATWNAVENKWKVEKGDKDFAKYVQQLNSLINVYGRVISGGGKGTVSDLEHARQMLNPNMPLSAVMGSLEGFDTEIGIAEAAPDEVRAKIRGGDTSAKGGGEKSDNKPQGSVSVGGKSVGWSVE